MNWILLLFFLTCSLHIYLHFIIHPDIRLSIIETISQNDITNTIYYKLPFILKDIKLHTLYFDTFLPLSKTKYSKHYDSMPLLEPLVKFFTKNTIFKLKKNKKISNHSNLHCRNFYIIHKGNCRVTLKNPINPQELLFELSENQILFIPNYWNIKIKTNEECIIEKLQYSTIMNQVNFIWDYIINLKTSTFSI